MVIEDCDFNLLKSHSEYLILEHIVKLHNMAKNHIVKNKKDFDSVYKCNKEQINLIYAMAEQCFDKDLFFSFRKLFNYYDDPTLRINIQAYVQKFNIDVLNKKYTLSTFIDEIPCSSYYEFSLSS